MSNPALQVVELIWITVDPASCVPFKTCQHPVQCQFCIFPLQVVELIWITVDPASCVPNPEMTGLAQLLVGRVMALRPRFSVALHKVIAGASGCVDVLMCSSKVVSSSSSSSH